MRSSNTTKPKAKAPASSCSFWSIMCSIVSALILILIIIIIVIVATFKKPTIALGTMEKSLSAPSNISDSSIVMTWNAGVKITNQNIFDLEITDLELLGSVETAPTSQHLVKGVSHKVKVNKGTTEFKVPMDLRWSNATDKDGKVHAQLMKSCKADGEQLPMKYTGFAAVKVWGIGPFKVPNIEISQKQKCPFDLSAVTEAAKMETKSSDDDSDDEKSEDKDDDEDKEKDEDKEEKDSEDDDKEEEEEKPKPKPPKRRPARKQRASRRKPNRSQRASPASRRQSARRTPPRQTRSSSARSSRRPSSSHRRRRQEDDDE